MNLTKDIEECYGIKICSGFKRITKNSNSLMKHNEISIMLFSHNQILYKS